MKIGVLKEQAARERRVAMVPDLAKKLIHKGHMVVVEHDAGLRAGFDDASFAAVGCAIKVRNEVVDVAEVLCLVQGFGGDTPALLGKPHQLIIGQFDALAKARQLAQLAEHGATLFSLDLLPRITRAQVMDVLSSQANLAGYAAVLYAAGLLPRAMPMQMTAAGTIKPAKVLVLGAGVMGLAAIATARRLGAMVFGFDVRPEANEQIQSLGAKVVEINAKESGSAEGGYAKQLSQEAQEALCRGLSEFASGMDIVITTAQIPGKNAPVLLNPGYMKHTVPGAIFIDGAGSTGGNIVGSVLDEERAMLSARLFAPSDLASHVAQDASTLYARNIEAFIGLLPAVGSALDLGDEILRATCVFHEKRLQHPRVMALVGA